MDIYDFESYKLYITEKIKENSFTKGYRSKLAEAAGCGRSFLSQVLNSSIHLTLDHGANICRFWQLDDARTNFFLDLMTYDRAGTPSLKETLLKRIVKSREKMKSVKQRQNSHSLQISQSLKESLYYSSWHYAAIHVLTAIPYFQTIESIALRLNLPSHLVEKILIDLREIELVEENNSLWQVKGPSVFLSKKSPISTINQTNWRHQAMEHLGKCSGEGIHTTGLYAISKVDVIEIDRIFSEAIESALNISKSSKEEDLFCLNIDFFRVTPQ